MKNFIKYLTSAFSITLAVACSPNSDENGDFLRGMEYTNSGGTPTTSNKTKILTKVIALDEDTGKEITYNYIYNTTNKLTRVTSSNSSVSFDVTYDADNKIKSIKKTNVDAAETTTEDFGLTYTSGLITKIERTFTSQNGEKATTIATLTNNPAGWATKINEVFTNPTDNSIVGTFVSDLTYSGKNLTKWNYVSKINMSTGPIPIFDAFMDLEINMTFSGYDTYKNPYNTLPKEFLIALLHTESQNNGIIGFSANNAKTIKGRIVFGGAPFESTSTAIYSYDNDGYPRAIVSEGVTMYKFEYKTL